jgi:hypothetical protein
MIEVSSFFVLPSSLPRGGDQPWTAMALLILESFATTDLPELALGSHHQVAKPNYNSKILRVLVSWWQQGV